MSEKENSVEDTTIKIPKEENKKNKIKFLIGGFLVLIAIAIGLYVGYKKLNNDPISIYKDAINDVYKSLNNSLKEAKKDSFNKIDIEKDPVVVDLDAKLTSNMKELKNFTGLNYHINAGMDLASKKMNVGLGVRDNKEQIINLILSVIGDNLYLKSEELYDKVLNLGKEEIWENMDFDSYVKVNGNEVVVDYDNYEYILKEMKKILIDSLDKKKFTMEEETIKIGNKEYKAKKAIYKLDKENMERTIQYIEDAILKEEKLVKAIASSIGITTEELKNNLKESPDMANYKDCNMILYADKFNNLIAGSLYEEDNRVVQFDCVEELNLRVSSEDSKLELKNENDTITIKMIQKDTELANFKITSKNDDVKIDYHLVIEEQAFVGTIKVSNVKVTKDKVEAELSFSINTKVLGSAMDLALDGKVSVQKKEIDTVDTNNSVKIDNLSEEEAMQIFMKLGPIVERFGLSDIFNQMM